MADIRTPASDWDDADGEQKRAVTAEAERHRELLRPAAERYRLRVARGIQRLGAADRAARIALAERQIERLMIDPEQHAGLDLAAYRAIRDRLPMRFDEAEQAFVVEQPGRAPMVIRPGQPEHRLGVIARLARIGVPMEQMQIVAIATD